MTAHNIKQLSEGKQVQFRPVGNSMTPRIKSRQLVTVVPADRPLVKDDIVFCRVKGNNYVHLVTAVDAKGRATISNNHGHINGTASKIYGIVVKVED